MISAEMVKDLREKSGAPMMDCKKALTEAGGDMEKAFEILRKSGAAKAAKKASREAKEGFIGSYIHSNGKVGVMVEINCETDFVAKNPVFRDFAKDVSMHIAAANPTYLKREDVPETVIAKEKEIQAAQITGKPANIVEKILVGKMDKFYSDVCLLEQKFIKDDKLSIKDILTSKITELGENLVLKRFTRFEVGI
ncbi:MAG: translation elongation factor Ts [uncultured bacterium]|nr:MAG: translation elongation factor Ts [uncultured bacterium]